MITKLFVILLLIMAVLATEREQAKNAVKIICENAIKKNVVKNICENAIRQIDWEDVIRKIIGKAIEQDDNVPNEQDNNAANNDDCPICYDPLDNEPIATTCGMHRFHSSCVKRWFKQRTTCPYCIQPVNEVQVKIGVSEFLNLGSQQQIIKQKNRSLKVASGVIGILSVLVAVMAAEKLPPQVIQVLQGRLPLTILWFAFEGYLTVQNLRQLVQSPNAFNLYIFLGPEAYLFEAFCNCVKVVDSLRTSKIGDFDAMFRYYKAPEVISSQQNSIQRFVFQVFQQGITLDQTQVVILFLAGVFTALSCFKTGNRRSAMFSLIVAIYYAVFKYDIFGLFLRKVLDLILWMRNY